MVFRARAVASAVLVTILVLVGAATWQVTRDAQSARLWSRHSFLVLRAIDELDVAMYQAETGQRGYVLTGDDDYLGPYTKAIARVAPLYGDLQSLTADNPIEQDRLGQLAPLLQLRLAELARTVQVRRDVGFDAAVSVVSGNHGRALMRQIEATLAAMIAEEETLLATRVADTDDRGAWVRGLMLGGTLFAVAALLWSAWVLDAAARTDGLTGLLSRNGMWQLLDARRRRLKPPRAALLSVDLDRFQSVNQIFGLVMGDRLLVEVGRRLKRIAGNWRVGRLGSDDFAIYCTGTASADAEKLGVAVTEVLAQPFELQGQSFRLTASVGVADSDNTADLDLRQAADEAMHVAKQQGGNRSVAFVPSIHDAQKALSELEQDLHQAIDRDAELFMVYQPIVRIADRALIAVEALARWNHPRLGVIPPDRFIGLAAQKGLMLPLGLKLAGLAIRQAALWHARFPGACPLVNINVSPVQFAAGDVIADLVKLLRQHGLPENGFCLEVTEGDFANADTIRALQDARQRGFKVSMDDFGVGYSSLGQLPRLPLTSVKLDRSFIVHAERAHDAPMLTAVVQLVHALKLDVVAEGVETQDQLDLVADCGCDAVQGYLYSRPLSPEALDVWLSGNVPLAAPSSAQTLAM
jgi:diguanylate cyclase (GGDEF)-like protein